MPGDDDDYRPDFEISSSAITDNNANTASGPSIRPRRERKKLSYEEPDPAALFPEEPPVPVYPHLQSGPLPTSSPVLPKSASPVDVPVIPRLNTTAIPPKKPKKKCFLVNLFDWLRENPDHEAARWTAVVDDTLVLTPEVLMRELQSKGHDMNNKNSLKSSLKSWGFQQIYPHAVNHNQRADVQYWKHFILTQGSSEEEIASVTAVHGSGQQQASSNIHQKGSDPTASSKTKLPSAVSAKHAPTQDHLALPSPVCGMHLELLVLMPTTENASSSPLMPVKKTAKQPLKAVKKYGRTRTSVSKKGEKAAAAFSGSSYKYKKQPGVHQIITRTALQKAGLDADTFQNIVSGPTSPATFSLSVPFTTPALSRRLPEPSTMLFEDTGSPLSSISDTPELSDLDVVPIHGRELSEDIEHSIDLQFNELHASSPDTGEAASLSISANSIGISEIVVDSSDPRGSQLAQELYELNPPSPEYYGSASSLDSSWPSSVDSSGSDYSLSPLRSASTNTSSDWPSDESFRESVIPAWASDFSHPDWTQMVTGPAEDAKLPPAIQEMWSTIEQIINVKTEPAETSDMAEMEEQGEEQMEHFFDWPYESSA